MMKQKKRHFQVFLSLAREREYNLFDFGIPPLQLPPIRPRVRPQTAEEQTATRQTTATASNNKTQHTRRPANTSLTRTAAVQLFSKDSGKSARPSRPLYAVHTAGGEYRHMGICACGLRLAISRLHRPNNTTNPTPLAHTHHIQLHATSLFWLNSPQRESNLLNSVAAERAG